MSKHQTKRFNQISNVQLLYPNDWLKKVKCIDSDADQFNWFLVGCKYQDEHGYYVLEVSPYSQFYCIPNGKTLTPKGLYKRREGQKTKAVHPKLLILNEPANQRLMDYSLPLGGDELVKLAKKSSLLGYHGVTLEVDQNLYNHMSPICDKAIFMFTPGVLIEKTDPTACEIIRYAKKYNSQIKEKTRFPNCQQIDEIVTRKGCTSASKKIFRLMFPFIES